MAQLIDLTVTRRKSANKDDSFATPLTYGFDVEDIVVPIRSDGSDSYFTARQLKGTHPSSKLVGNTNYWVSENLAAIAAKSDLLVNLTVTKRRNVDVANEKYVFVTSRFSENIKVSDTGGSKFFYQEDGDANLVEYEVSETIAQIVTQGNLPAGGFIEVTYAQALDAAVKCELVEGEHYKITDRADLGIMLLATTPCSFSLEGQGIFLNPDFQDVGALTGAMDGVWYAGGEAGYVNGEVVIWGGLHYQVTDDGAFAGTSPDVTPLAYTLLPKSVANGYIEEVDFILYDFANDVIKRRVDKRANDVNGTDKFQWGNDNVLNNMFLSNAGRDMINQRGYVDGNTIIDSGNLALSNNFTGNFNYNLVGKSAWLVDSNIDITMCTLNQFHSGVTTLVITAEGKIIDNLGSTFEADLDMRDNNITLGTHYNLPSLSLQIPASLNYVGIFNLLDNTGQTIEKIENLPSHKCKFYVENGNTQLFSHTAVAGAVADELVSDAAAINTITGRTNGSDFIEYERAGNLNRRYNAVIAA